MIPQMENFNKEILFQEQNYFYKNPIKSPLGCEHNMYMKYHEFCSLTRFLPLSYFVVYVQIPKTEYFWSQAEKHHTVAKQ